ncbi:ABC transporter ATP-binding protein [Methanofollis fontis]|uniref:Lipoprotein-releasing system ATP-binding protein LolD n=1 Tax=Methanofollis fontis TaxID=2052832 RepID=A0A483CTV3_9EURY|nr:ABC transporter ATP-binding protein [Methanofollis fontis]TAJ44704.1 lipoprotein-releasing system ATP-binding protein LolD [Methanofollis fontis]
MSSAPVISLRDVTRVYSIPAGDVVALDGVSLDIMEGEFVAIMGPSGSGKSTLLNQIGSLDVPTSGDLFIDGRNIREMNDDELTDLRRDTIGYIFQRFNLIPLLTLLENVEYPLILKYGRRDTSGRPAELLRMVGLEGSILEHTPNEISGGQQQRVAIARALVNDPQILLCDEPTGNLDTKTGEQIMEILTDLNRQGRTIIMVTHDPATAEYAHRTIVIRDGRIVS